MRREEFVHVVESSARVVLSRGGAELALVGEIYLIRDGSEINRQY